MGAAGRVHAIQANVSAAFPSTSKNVGRMDSWAGMGERRAQLLNASATFVVSYPSVPFP